MLSFFMNVMTAMFVYATLFLLLLRLAIAFRIKWGTDVGVLTVVVINIFCLIASVLFVTL